MQGMNSIVAAYVPFVCNSYVSASWLSLINLRQQLIKRTDLERFS